MLNRVLQRTQQPRTPVRVASDVPENVHVGYPLESGWFNATKGRITGHRTFYDPSQSSSGTVWVPNTNAKSIDLGFTAAPTYAILMVLDIRTAALTSSSTAINMFAPSQDYTGTSGDMIRAGSSTGLVTGEVLCVSVSSTSNRTAMTDTLNVGRQVVCVQWDTTLGKYRWWLNGKLANFVETATPSALKTIGPYFEARGNSVQAYMCPALIAVSHVEGFELVKYMDRPFSLLQASTRLPVNTVAAGGPPTLAAITASNITATGARLTVTT